MRIRPSRRVVAGATVVVAIVVTAAVWLRATTPAAPLSWPALRNAAYPTSLRQGTVQLRDGIFEAEAAPGSASRTIVRLVDLGAFGDIDGDGRPDAAVIVLTSGGGTGLFVDLVAVRNDGGVARPVARALLGDRVLVREVRIEDRQILVRLRIRGAADPLALLTRETTRAYVLDGGALTLRTETTADVPLTVPDDFVYRPERVDLAPGDTRSVDGSLAPGQIASYVVRGLRGQVLELHSRSLFNNGILSVSGLTDGITYVSRQEYAVDRSLVLPADEDFAVRVVSLAGQTLPFTLTLTLQAAPAAPLPTASASPLPLPTATPRPVLPPSSSLAERPLAQLSDAATRFARSRPPVWGVAVIAPGRQAIYTENADEQVPTASVVKVLVMLVVLEQARQEKRLVSESELALLWPMITESDNDATSQLWESIGRGPAVSAYLRAIGVTGFTPDAGTQWGVSFASARAMATALAKLLAGEILDEGTRTLALRLLDGVIPQQRWGITAGTAGDDAIGIKNGWYPGDEGWRVNSVGIVRPKGGNAYAIAVMTGGRVSWREGIDTIEGIAESVNGEVRGAPR